MAKPKKKPSSAAKTPNAPAQAAAKTQQKVEAAQKSPFPTVLWATLGALAVLTLAAYWPALDNQFVDWDDPAYVTENGLLNPATNTSLRALWKTVVSLNYHPLTMTTLWWNALNEGIASARPYIATNVFFHVLNTLLATLLAWHLSGKKALVAALTGLGFGLHPMHVESVAWVSERKDVLYAFFFFLAMLVYWRYIQKGAWWALILCFGFFALSCLSKAMAVALVPVLFLLDYWHGRAWWKASALLEKIPFIALAVFFGLVALDIQGGGNFHGWLNTVERQDAITDFSMFSPFQRLQFAAYGFMMYMVKLVVPSGLSAFYPYPSCSAA
jgi:protein O-mannosyl-transferase